MIIASVVGNLGRDAELKNLDNGTVSNFSVASGAYNYKTKEKETTWVECSLWGKKAQSLNEYLKQGAKVHVSGELSFESYTSKKDGEVRFSKRLNVDNIELCGSKQNGSGDHLPGWD